MAAPPVTQLQAAARPWVLSSQASALHDDMKAVCQDIADQTTDRCWMSASTSGPVHIVHRIQSCLLRPGEEGHERAEAGD